MAEDREVLREVWDGRVPVSFTLSSDEVVSMQQPDPYYVMVPRVSYFSLVLDKVTKHFSKYLAENKQNSNDIWLDFDGQPVKWNYPIGLNWDLYGSESTLPWNITVHFSNFPEEELVRCSSRSAIESIFISTIKEAGILKHRGAVMDSLQKKDHNQLWLGLQNDKFDQFWSVNKKLMENSADRPFNNIPVRVYQTDSQSTCFIQKMVKPIKDKETGEQTTLGDFITELRLNPPKLHAKEMKPYIVLHGIEPPFETPVQWLSEHMSYPDNFLHLCLRWREATIKESEVGGGDTQEPSSANE
jgi:autophagy-related protein 5